MSLPSSIEKKSILNSGVILSLTSIFISATPFWNRIVSGSRSSSPFRSVTRASACFDSCRSIRIVAV